MAGAVWSAAVVACMLFCDVFAHTTSEIEHAKKILKNLPANCGVTSFVENNIISGAPAPIGKYPWIVALGYKRRASSGPPQKGKDVVVYLNNEPFNVLCAGSLITDQWIVTAAHCITPSSRPMVARLGDLDLDDGVLDGATSAVTVSVGEIKVNENYDNDKKIYDIALIKLKNKVQYVKDRIVPICLPNDRQFAATNAFEGEETNVAGWGVTENKVFSTHLLEVAVRVADMDGCRKNYTEKNSKLVLDNRVICAGGTNSDFKDACSGDSGGPQMKYLVKNGQEKAYLMGVVSYGRGCAQPGYPGVYARVSAMMTWILKNLDI